MLILYLVKQVRKIIAISFLLIISFSHLGYYCIYRFHQYQLKEEMEARIFEHISDADLEVFELQKNSSDIEWEEEGKEFILQHELYDVVKIKIVGAQTLLYCINDKKEAQLIRDYSKALKAGND